MGITPGNGKANNTGKEGLSEEVPPEWIPEHGERSGGRAFQEGEGECKGPEVGMVEEAAHDPAPWQGRVRTRAPGGVGPNFQAWGGPPCWFPPSRGHRSPAQWGREGPDAPMAPGSPRRSWRSRGDPTSERREPALWRARTLSGPPVRGSGLRTPAARPLMMSHLVVSLSVSPGRGGARASSAGRLKGVLRSQPPPPALSAAPGGASCVQGASCSPSRHPPRPGVQGWALPTQQLGGWEGDPGPPVSGREDWLSQQPCLDLVLLPPRKQACGAPGPGPGTPPHS